MDELKRVIVSIKRFPNVENLIGSIEFSIRDYSLFGYGGKKCFFLSSVINRI